MDEALLDKIIHWVLRCGLTRTNNGLTQRNDVSSKIALKILAINNGE